PFYFTTGGLGGASAALAYLVGLRGNRELARNAWAIAAIDVGISPALLISDLGKPSRFLNMLRMFKVTSPMSVGTWLLSASGAAVPLPRGSRRGRGARRRRFPRRAVEHLPRRLPVGGEPHVRRRPAAPANRARRAARARGATGVASRVDAVASRPFSRRRRGGNDTRRADTEIQGPRRVGPHRDRRCGRGRGARARAYELRAGAARRQ